MGVDAKPIEGNIDHFPVELHDGSMVDVFLCKVKHIGPVTRLIEEAFHILEIRSLADLKDAKLDEPATYLKLFANGFDSLASVSSLLCTLDVEAFSELELDDAIRIIMKQVEVNKDFFTSRVMPLLDGIVLSESPIQQDDTVPTNPTLEQIASMKKAASK